MNTYFTYIDSYVNRKVPKINVYNLSPDSRYLRPKKDKSRCPVYYKLRYRLYCKRNHFSVSHPKDYTTGRPFLDLEATTKEAELRNLIASAIGLFIDARVRNQTTALEGLHQMLASNNPLIASFEQK